MEAYANALLYAIPGFVALILVEVLYGHWVKNQTHRLIDTISSLTSGLTNILKDTLGLAITLISYPYLVEHLAIIEIKATWLVYLVAFIVLDFAGYWNHRLSHRVNIFWNQHVIHHSSEEFNLACALRQSISNVIGYFPLFLIPAAFLGVPNKVIALLAPIHLFAQFWYHTKHIGKLGWLEYIIVTPSQHRVHHAINPEYIDKNLGQVFCVWDRMFGTFQEEMDDCPPVYGVLKPAATWNPIRINFQHVWRLIQDAWRTRSLWDKVRIWFMPTGWRPKDVIESYPVHIIEDVYHFEKYKTPVSRFISSYALFQLLTLTAFLLHMLYLVGDIGMNDLLFYGGFLFVSIYGFTSLMDHQRSGVIIELIRPSLGIAYLLTVGDWFQVSQDLVLGNALVLTYFVVTFFSTLYFYRYELRKPIVNTKVG